MVGAAPTVGLAPSLRLCHALALLMHVMLLYQGQASSTRASNCSRYWLTEQDVYSSFDLASLGIEVGAVSINDDYFSAGGGRSLEQMLRASEKTVESALLEYVVPRVQGGRNGTVLVVMDLESPANPGNLSGFDDTELLDVVHAFQLRICVMRRLFPHVKLALYGTVEGIYLPGSLTGLHRASALGLFDDIDYLIPVLYTGPGMDVVKHTQTVLAASETLTTSSGEKIPLAPMLSWVEFGATQDNCAAPFTTTHQVLATIEDFKAKGTQIPIIQFWSGQDDETSKCADKQTQWQWLQKANIVPAECKKVSSNVSMEHLIVPTPTPLTLPHVATSSETCTRYTQAGFAVKSFTTDFMAPVPETWPVQLVAQAPNTGGAMIHIRGSQFNASKAEGKATCKFFMNRDGMSWGTEIGTDPFTLIQNNQSDFVVPATVVNSSYAFCVSPRIELPTGNKFAYLGPNVSIGGPISVDISMNGHDYSGVAATDPHNLNLFAPFSVTFGRNKYMGQADGTLLYNIHPSVNLTAPAITLACGSNVLLSAVPVLQSKLKGLLPVKLPTFSQDVNVSCVATLHSKSDAQPVATQNLQLIKLLKTIPYATSIDYASRSIWVDDAPFFPFGFFTHEYGPFIDSDQMYLSSKGVNNFMHYYPENFAPAVDVPQINTILDTATQLGSFVQVDTSNFGTGGALAKGTANMSNLENYFQNISQLSGIWSYYDSDDTIVDNVSATMELHQIISKNDPYHVVSKAQGDVSVSYAFQNLGDTQMAEMYCSRGATCTLILGGMLTQYPMDWTPQMICGDGGAYGSRYAGEPGTWLETMRSQWFGALTQGAVGNSLFIFITWAPWILPESSAEMGLSSFELAPTLHGAVFAEQLEVNLTGRVEDLELVALKTWRDAQGCILAIALNRGSTLDGFGYQMNALNVTVHLSLGGKPIGNLPGVKPFQGMLPVNISDGAFTIDLHGFEAEAWMFNCSNDISPGTSLVYNGGMEKYLIPGFPIGWELSGNTLAESGNVSAYAFSETRFAHQGRHSLRISVPFDTYRLSRVAIPGFMAKKGAKYTVTAWGRVYTPSMCKPLLVHDAGGQTVGSPVTLPVGKWGELSFGSGVASADGPLSFVCGSGGTFYLDDVAVASAAHNDFVAHTAVGTATVRHDREESGVPSPPLADAGGAWMTVDEAPFIPMGWVADRILEHGSNFTMHHVGHLSSRAVNTILFKELGPFSDVNISVQEFALNASFAGGIKAVINLTPPSPGKEIDSAYFAKIKYHPAVLGYFIDCGSNEQTVATQQAVFATVKKYDPQRLVFSLQKSAAAAAPVVSFYDVLLVPATAILNQQNDTVSLLAATAVAAKPTLALGGDPFQSQPTATLFHQYGARSSQLKHAVYGSLLLGARGFIMSTLTPGTPYSLVNVSYTVLLRLCTCIGA